MIKQNVILKYLDISFEDRCSLFGLGFKVKTKENKEMFAILKRIINLYHVRHLSPRNNSRDLRSLFGNSEGAEEVVKG